MPCKRLLPIAAAGVLCACSGLDGLYSPSCVAYEGDEIELAGGRFTWRRFTDERVIDDHGEVMDPFPDYPKSGRYELAGTQVTLMAADGGMLATFHVHNDKDGTYLMTDAENEVLARNGSSPECALRRAD